MDRVQFPPDANPVFHTVIPITGEIEHDQINNERDDRLRRDARPKIVEFDIGDIVQPQPTLKTVKEWLKREEKEQVQDAQLDDPCIQRVHAHAFQSWLRLHNNANI